MPNSELNEEIYQFAEEQITMVNETLEEVKAGKFLTDEEANREIDEWLDRA